MIKWHLTGKVVAAKIIHIKKENRDMNSLYLKPLENIQEPKPGQFFMIWVPGLEEIPISVADYYKGIFRFVVAKRGKTTTYILNMDVGQLLGLKGPLGNFLRIESRRRYLLVGGGYGSAPLLFVARIIKQKNSFFKFLIGTKNKAQILFQDEAEKFMPDILFSTEDGSFGFHGTVVDLAKETLKEEKFDYIVACGPMSMLKNIVKLAESLRIKSYVLVEEIMKCGIGLCGSCVIGNTGLLACKDGPVFEGNLIF
ncbi:MAG: dihydroorotate dehydrogenase electron transfer subunit [Candidatus Njordarchaeia archaeon]